MAGIPVGGYDGEGGRRNLAETGLTGQALKKKRAYSGRRNTAEMEGDMGIACPGTCYACMGSFGMQPADSQVQHRL